MRTNLPVSNFALAIPSTNFARLMMIERKISMGSGCGFEDDEVTFQCVVSPISYYLLVLRQLLRRDVNGSSRGEMMMVMMIK